MKNKTHNSVSFIHSIKEIINDYTRLPGVYASIFNIIERQ